MGLRGGKYLVLLVMVQFPRIHELAFQIVQEANRQAAPRALESPDTWKPTAVALSRRRRPFEHAGGRRK
jgi:hypothetical protein